MILCRSWRDWRKGFRDASVKWTIHDRNGHNHCSARKSFHAILIRSQFACSIEEASGPRTRAKVFADPFLRPAHVFIRKERGEACLMIYDFSPLSSSAALFFHHRLPLLFCPPPETFLADGELFIRKRHPHSAVLRLAPPSVFKLTPKRSLDRQIMST